MGRLLNPGLGDYLDRLTILHLKIRYGLLGDRAVAHFRNEADGIEQKIALRTSLKAGEVAELAAVNAALWGAEDDLRRLRGRPDGAAWQQEVVTVAIRIQELNDSRAALVQAINVGAGDHIGGSEK